MEKEGETKKHKDERGKQGGERGRQGMIYRGTRGEVGEEKEREE